jgi:hypothetical protein
VLPNYIGSSNAGGSVVIGQFSGAGLTTGFNNVIVGRNAQATGNFSNCVVLGNGSATADNQVVFGVTGSTVILPVSHNTMDLGSTGVRFKDLYLSGAANVTNISATNATVTSLTVTNATCTNLTATTETCGTLLVTTSTTLNDDAYGFFYFDNQNITVTTSPVGVGVTSISTGNNQFTHNGASLLTYTGARNRRFLITIRMDFTDAASGTGRITMTAVVGAFVAPASTDIYIPKDFTGTGTYQMFLIDIPNNTTFRIQLTCSATRTYNCTGSMFVRAMFF